MIYIIRHGQTALNQAKALQGRSNAPLNERGISQAEEAGLRLRARGVRFHRVYSSPLDRALQTAELAAGSAEIRVDQRLIEMDYGPYEGANLEHLPPEVLDFFSDFANSPAPVGMEQLSAVTGRLGEFLEAIKDEARQGDVLISTHAIAMKGALEYLTPDSGGRYWSKYVGNCEIYTAELKNGRYTVPAPLAWTELDKMVTGQLYDPSDPELTRLRVRVRKLARQYNQTDEDEPEQQRRLLQQMLPCTEALPVFQAPVWLEYGRNVSFGPFCFANFNFTCMDVAPIRVGSQVMIGPNVTLATPMHPLCYEDRNVRMRPDGSCYDLEYARPITIEQNCWIASNVVICGGVTVGEGSVIGAGSVVTRDIPPHSLAAGNPCRVIRRITERDRMG